jgi:hypothetical protein
VWVAGGGLRSFERHPFIRKPFDELPENKAIPLNYSCPELEESPFAIH